MTITTQIPPEDRRVPEWELCDRLRRSLRLVKLPHEEMAYFLGVDKGTVSRWINGHNRPTKPTLMIWATITGVDENWLIHGHVDELVELRACRDSNPKPSDP